MGENIVILRIVNKPVVQTPGKAFSPPPHRMPCQASDFHHMIA